MNLSEPLPFIFGRRSIRVFKPGTVSETITTQLLQAAMAAPSAVARDPWRFVVSQQRDLLAALASVLANGAMLNTASLCIAIGHPGEEKPPRTRFNPALVHWEHW